VERRRKDVWLSFISVPPICTHTELAAFISALSKSSLRCNGSAVNWTSTSLEARSPAGDRPASDVTAGDHPHCWVDMSSGRNSLMHLDHAAPRPAALWSTGIRAALEPRLTKVRGYAFYVYYFFEKCTHFKVFSFSLRKQQQQRSAGIAALILQSCHRDAKLISQSQVCQTAAVNALFSLVVLLIT